MTEASRTKVENVGRQTTVARSRVEATKVSFSFSWYLRETENKRDFCVVVVNGCCGFRWVIVIALRYFSIYA